MYNTAYFSRMPRSQLPGTKSKKPQIVSGTSLHGEIIPLFCNLVMPGTIDSNIMNGEMWMSSPISPIMSQIKCAVNVFFVPLRLVWDNAKEFFGENRTQAGPQSTTFTVPSQPINSTSGTDTHITVGCVSHYLGKPLYKGSSIDSAGNLKASILKERAYWLVISEYYRHQQVQNPVVLNKGNVSLYASNPIGTIGMTQLKLNSMPAKCLKDFDYFTTATISPSYGGSVTLPLGTLAPVLIQNSNPGITTNAATTFTMKNNTTMVQGATSTIQLTNSSNNGTATLIADLRNATAAQIDDLYTAMAAQAWYHNSNYGSRYFEMLEIHYGVSNPDLVLDRPEHVSEFTFDIVVQDVISTAGATNDSSTKLGQPGGYSKTYIRKRLYNHSFGEWGFVIALMNTYHQRYYSAGLAREDLYSELFDFYFPEFANRGDDYIYRAEVFGSSGVTDNLNAWAYQEAYADRRYYQARATGQLDAYCDANVNGKGPIGRWILNEKWASRPSFGEQFLTEDRSALADALVSGSAGPDFIWNFNFEHTEILPMPAHSKPGIPSFGRGLV